MTCLYFYSVLFNSGTSFFLTTAVPDKLTTTYLRLAPQRDYGSESAFICLCGPPRLSLAHIQRKGAGMLLLLARLSSSSDMTGVPFRVSAGRKTGLDDGQEEPTGGWTWV